MADLSQSLTFIRSVLTQLRPSGDGGFEGLVASLIAAKTGLQIRLAKSGSQFGRDASSPRDLFAIAMEAKRYDSNLRLEELLGKATVAGFALGADTDLWVIGATTEIGDDIVRKVTIVVEQNGMSVLFLDWSPAPLPPLALLLASSPETVVAWFGEHSPTTELEAIESALGVIRSAKLFGTSEATLLHSLAASSVGLDALQTRNRLWLEARWSNALLSRQDLGQVVTPLAKDRGVLTGRATRLGLEKKISVRAEPTTVALLGEEGVGKTWLVADWWLSSSNPPILLPVLGRAVEVLDSQDVFGSLAKLMMQHQKDSQIDRIGWERRLRRWAARPASATPWCVVVLDGLNERPDLPWADIILSFARTLSEMGALLVVTCRPVFWKREVLHRLRRELVVDELHVPDYSELEVRELLLKADASPTNLSERLRTFLRNPRVCTVALTLVGELNASVEELTVERLQLEYWRHRLAERGSLLAHNSDEFHKVLMAHAKDWLVDPAQQFELDNLSTRSTLAARKPTAIVTDLSEIVEGRFMTASGDDEGTYEFRPDAMPFAIGLLLAREVRGLRNPTKKLYEATIDALIEPVRAFDSTSLIVGAAFSLACLDTSFPIDGMRSLLESWVSLQNVDHDAVERISPNVVLRADLFCDVLEELNHSADYHAHLDELARIVFQQAHHQSVRRVLHDRIPQWLRRWCRKAIPFPRETKPNLDRESVQNALAQLLPVEREEFEELCLEVLEPKATDTDELAAFQMVALPQKDLVRGLWAWCLAQTIAGDHTNAQEDLSWAIRLNRYDWPSTASAVQSIVGSVTSSSSEPYRRSAARLLRLLGDLRSEGQAEGLIGPIVRSEPWRRVSIFCDTDPHDPGSPVCANLAQCIDIVESIPIDSLRVGRSPNIEDHNWASAMPALARFSVESLLKAVRRFIASIEAREGMALIALSWDLPEYSALLNDASLALIERALLRFAVEGTDWNDAENQLIVNEALAAILPQLPASRQLEILMDLPSGVQMYVNFFGSALKQLDTAQFESALVAAAKLHNTAVLGRVLFAASAHPIVLSAASRDIVSKLIARKSGTERNIAFNLARMAGDPVLDQEILDSWEEAPSADEDFYREEAVAKATIRSGRSELLRLVTSDRRQAVAAQMGDDAIVLIIEELEATLERLLKPIVSLKAQPIIIEVEATSDGLMQRIDVSLKEPEDLMTLIENSNTSNQQYNERGRQARRARKEFSKKLEEEGAESLLCVPFPECIRRVVAIAPERVRAWLRRLASENDEEILEQVFNLGAVLAGEFARVDGALAAEVLVRLRDLQPLQTISWGGEHIPLYMAAAFAKSDAPEMEALREWFLLSAMNDEELEACSRAASVGCRPWLHKFIREHCLAENPNLQARAITLAGFCLPEDDLVYVFEEDRRSGFLGNVRRYASKQRERAVWAAHWCGAALAAEDPIDFWRFSKLAEGTVDARFIRAFDHFDGDNKHVAFKSELISRLDKAAKKRTEKRKETLFGNRVPSDSLTWAIRESRKHFTPDRDVAYARKDEANERGMLEPNCRGTGFADDNHRD